MNPYPKYKDSGVEWIGEVPEGWKVEKIKWLIVGKLQYGANESAILEDKTLPRYIRITDFTDDGHLKEETFKSLPEDVAKDYMLNNGDILFARSGATVGKTFQFKEYIGSACFAGYLIKATPNKQIVLSGFLYLYTKSFQYEFWRNSIFNQATIQNIGADKYAYLDVVLPPLNEQTAIAAFLDRKTADIDSIIAKKERLIELYEEEKAAVINHAVTKGLDPAAKMKDSGIEWLGEIPEHWEVKCVKHALFFHDNKRIPLSSEVRGNMLTKEYDYYGASGVIDKVEDYIFDGEYILLGEDGANLLTRSTALAFKATGKFWVNNHAHILTPKNGNIDFFIHSLEHIDYTIYVSGSAQPKLTAEALGEVKIAFPALTEQTTIVEHIETKCGHIDAIISKFKRQIELLKEYRTALISEAVTGKIDLRHEI